MKCGIKNKFEKVWVSRESELTEIRPSKVYNVFRKIFLAVFILTLFFILFSNYIRVDGVTIAMVVLLCFIGFLFYRYDAPHFSLFLFLSTLLITVFISLVIDTPIVNDFGVQYEAAQSFAKGYFSFG